MQNNKAVPIEDYYNSLHREYLMKNMYADNRIVSYRTIDSHIKKLRKKLADISEGKDWIQSVYGVGYRLAGE